MKKNTSHGKPVSTSSGQADGAKKGPVLKVHVGDTEPLAIYPALADDVAWAELREQCEQADGRIVLEIVSLPKWPDDGRFSLLTLAKALGTQCRVRVGKQIYIDPFEAVLAAMPGLKSMDAHRQGLHAAIEAAALFHGDMPDQAAKRINDQLAEVGAGKMNFASLTKQIRGTAGMAKPNERLDAHAAAQGFLIHLAKVVEAHGDQSVLRYYQNEVYLWNGKAWKRQEDKNFEAQVMRFLQTMEIPSLTERFSRDVLAHLRGMANLNCWDEPTPFLVVNEVPLEIEHPRLIVFNNGAIDLDDVIADTAPKIKPVDSTYFNEIVLPYGYKSTAKCKLWTQTVKDILPVTGDGDNRQLVLQEYMGYSLLQDCRYQKMLAAIGEGGNGKTTIIKTWQAMLGTSNFSAVPLEVLGNEHRQWSLKAKLVNFSAEFPYLGRVNEGMLKSLVSGEEIEVNRKFKSPVKIRPYAKLVVHANDLPQILDPTEGTWDRLIAMPFDARIRDTEQDDKNRLEKLRKELPGIMLWTIEGLKRLLKQGHFTSCAKCAAFLGRYRNEGDTVRHFATQCCVKSAKHETYSESLYDVYRQFADATGRKQPVHLVEFGRRMARMGWIKGRGKAPQRRPIYKEMKLTSTGRDHFDRWRTKTQHPHQSIDYAVPAKAKMKLKKK